MVPVRYDPAQHFEQVQSWYAHRNEVLTPDALPRVGFIVPGKAAGFLYQTDSSVAWIEGLVASPSLSKAERLGVVDAIVVAVCEESRKLGFKTLLGYTVLDVVVERAKRLGFGHVGGGFHLVALGLTPPT
ncbi:hypothetical protein JGU66_19025 [Myxococcaceae bacterium JPH2]|nr:hypothetical protein [Myxococcaceae bacterium JPH2]